MLFWKIWFIFFRMFYLRYGMGNCSLFRVIEFENIWIINIYI